jgi:ABC-type xylose transport system permease subunit
MQLLRPAVLATAMVVGLTACDSATSPGTSSAGPVAVDLPRADSDFWNSYANGGKGTLFGALCGVLVLGLITNILTLAGVSAQWIQAVYGLIILVALILARVTTGKAQDS